jgi:hypothetical protein
MLYERVLHRQHDPGLRFSSFPRSASACFCAGRRILSDWSTAYARRAFPNGTPGNGPDLP